MPTIHSDVLDVAVVGCGFMGAALARALAERGCSVTVWNRTHERALELTSERIRPVREMCDVVAGARVILVCLTDYDATYAAFAPVEDWADTVLVNLASGIPREAEEMGRWASERGARYIDGSMFCYPDDIGTTHGLFAYAGSEVAWRQVEPVAQRLDSTPAYLGEDVTAATALLMGSVLFYLPAAVACAEMSTYLQRQGVGVDGAIRVMRTLAHNLLSATEEIYQGIENHDHHSSRAVIDTYAHGDQLIAEELSRVSQRAPVATAATRLLAEASAAGIGGLGLSALSDLLTDAPARTD
jgi:3-hydroxyisobutyrate dehydrogenase-like beta-hydroxyacid dehydrogenase